MQIVHHVLDGGCLFEQIEFLKDSSQFECRFHNESVQKPATTIIVKCFSVYSVNNANGAWNAYISGRAYKLLCLFISHQIEGII